jgi:hypothetical protein
MTLIPFIINILMQYGGQGSSVKPAIPLTTFKDSHPGGSLKMKGRAQKSGIRNFGSQELQEG